MWGIVRIFRPKIPTFVGIFSHFGTSMGLFEQHQSFPKSFPQGVGNHVESLLFRGKSRFFSHFSLWKTLFSSPFPQTREIPLGELRRGERPWGCFLQKTPPHPKKQKKFSPCYFRRTGRRPKDGCGRWRCTLSARPPAPTQIRTSQTPSHLFESFRGGRGGSLFQKAPPTNSNFVY